jgi:hypothetical protein
MQPFVIVRAAQVALVTKSAHCNRLRAVALLSTGGASLILRHVFESKIEWIEIRHDITSLDV